MTDLSPRKPSCLEDRAIDQLIAHDRNARTHSKAQLKQIAQSIGRFGFVNPILINENDQILAGHGRVAAARSLGMKTVPVVRIEGMSEAERRAYVVADNKLATLAGWDDALLRLELGAILALDEGFDLELTGFAGAEIEALLNATTAPVAEAEADIPVLATDERPISSPGQIWCLGRHRLICGDSRDPEVYQRLLVGERAQMVITDPPYNVRVNGHVGGLGKIRHPEFAMASGEMSSAEFEAFLETVLGNLRDFSVDGSIHYIFMDWRHLRELLAAGDAVYDELKNLIVWNKDNGGMGSFYRSKHELVLAFKKGTAAHVNNFELGQHGRYRTNVWDYAGINSMQAGRAETLAMHPTVKPVEMIADAMRDCSKRNGIVLDAFCGSGTTLLAAERTGRRARAIEYDPHYVDVAIRRWQAETGKVAISEASGATFTEIETMFD